MVVVILTEVGGVLIVVILTEVGGVLSIHRSKCFFGKVGPTWSKFHPERKNFIVSHLDKGPNGLFGKGVLFCMHILLNIKVEIIRTNFACCFVWV